MGPATSAAVAARPSGMVVAMRAPSGPWRLPALMSVSTQPGATQLTAIPGAPPDLLAMPSGCSFHPRCPYATELCGRQAPPLFTIGAEHLTACFHRDRVTRRQDVWEEDHREETPPFTGGELEVVAG